MASVEKPVPAASDLPLTEVESETVDLERKEQKDASENEAEDSSSESSDSGGSCSTAGGLTACIGAKFNLIQADENGKYLCVSCAENEAKFYLNRFARGSIGKCILFNDKWLTPNEFQAVSGRQSSKDWKRSIRLRGRCLKEYIYQGLFQEHVKACACRVCCGRGIEHTEEEVTLAPKRRKLSNGESSHALIESTPQKTPSSSTGTSEKKRGRPPKVQKVWSPSGEVAQDSSNDGDLNVTAEDEEEEYDLDPPAQQDSPLPCPRAVRKSCGYRTELGTFARKPSSWNHEEVADFLRLHGFGDYATAFQDAEIDGVSLFLLKEAHMIDQFSMKLGPALRLLDTVTKLTHPPIS